MYVIYCFLLFIAPEREGNQRAGNQAGKGRTMSAFEWDSVGAFFEQLIVDFSPSFFSAGFHYSWAAFVRISFAYIHLFYVGALVLKPNKRARQKVVLKSRRAKSWRKCINQSRPKAPCIFAPKPENPGLKAGKTKVHSQTVTV